LLTRLPEATALLLAGQPGSQGPALKAAADQTADRLLEQLAGKDGAAAQVAAASLKEAGAAARRIATLVRQLEDDTVKTARRAHLNTVRQQLDAGCRTRFAAGLRDEVLAPLQMGGSADIRAVEAAARDLRALETEARVIGGGSAYDLMLRQAADALKSLPEAGPGLTDRLRLVEILAGSDAAMEMLDNWRGS
jgi:hypothetical protein